MTGLRDLTNLQQEVGKDNMASILTCYCKLLLSKEEAAEALVCSVPGESALTDLEMLTNVVLSISPPDADEVVVVLTGPIHNIHAALGFVAERIGCMRDAEFTSLLRRKVVTLRVVVPNSVVGVLMGRSGKDIRNLAVSCGVRIQISQRVPGVLERVVHITGTVAQVVLAAASVVETIQADPHTHEHAKRLLASLALSTPSVFNTPEPLTSAPAMSFSLQAPQEQQPSSSTSSTREEDEENEEAAVQHLQQLLNTLALHPELLADL